MKILIACEFSGRVRDAFARRGHDVTSCDILPTDRPPVSNSRHYQGDVMDILGDGWDLMVGHPSCQYLSNSGVCHLHKGSAIENRRWPKLFEARAFFQILLNANIPKICIENPVMHKYGKQLIGGVRQSQTVQPWMFGHMEQKATCLWLKGLPKLKPTKDVKAAMMKLPDNQRQKLHYLPPSKDRAKLRSTTFEGLAKAMAKQWGSE